MYRNMNDMRDEACVWSGVCVCAGTYLHEGVAAMLFHCILSKQRQQKTQVA